MVKMKDQSNSETVSAEFARSWWKSLMANTVALVEDAALLASHKSPVRAQSLIVHALEELAKARWLYEEAEHQWRALWAYMDLNLAPQTTSSFQRGCFPYDGRTPRNCK